MPSGYNSSHTGEWQDDLFNLIYPVGSIYLSVNSTNPSVLFGGTWEQIQDKFLLSAGSTYAAGTTGGAASVTSGGTALTQAQIPAHTHTRGTMEIEGTWWTAWNQNVRGFHNLSCTGAFYSHIDKSRPGRITSEDANANNGGRNGMPWFKASGGWTGETSSVGGNEAHSHTVSTMPPYLSVYVWKRTA